MKYNVPDRVINDIDIDELLAKFVERSKEIIGNNLIGIYLHGSAAMGCFHQAKSDVDLIVVKNVVGCSQENIYGNDR